jgi:hypothetical protein
MLDFAIPNQILDFWTVGLLDSLTVQMSKCPKNYLAPYSEASGLAMVIDDTKRQIAETQIVK